MVLASLSDILSPGNLSTVYWACLVAGGGLIVLSMLAGGHGSDADSDFDTGVGLDSSADAAIGVPQDFAVDVPHDALDALHAKHAGHVSHNGSTALSQWLSLRFLVYFAGVFGAVGVILTNFADFSTGVVLLVAALAGIVVGQLVQQTLRAILRTSGNSAPTAQEYVNRLARVTIPIQPPHRGEVALQVRSSERRIPAAADGAYETGEQVVVVAYRGGVAEVVSRESYANRSKAGGLS